MYFLFILSYMKDFSWSCVLNAVYVCSINLMWVYFIQTKLGYIDASYILNIYTCITYKYTQTETTRAGTLRGTDKTSADNIANMIFM